MDRLELLNLKESILTFVIRARSIFERALEVEYTNQLIWLRYVEMEMKNRNINRARNLFDRVVTYIPSVHTFWYKYVYMEELLGNIRGARQVFERWLKWEPPEEVWMSYVKMELRYKETALARNIMKRFVELYPDTKNWIKWSKFELSAGRPGKLLSILEYIFNSLKIWRVLYTSFVPRCRTRCSWTKISTYLLPPSRSDRMR